MDNFTVFVNQTVGIWLIIKWLLMGGALGYLVLMATSWDRRLLGGLALSALVFLLAGCTLNEGTRPADAMIAASQASASSASAQAAAQAQAAQLAAQAQQAQLTALQVAAQEAQTARADAQAQQAAENGLQANADALNASTMAGAIVALDNANERAAQRSTWLGWLLVAIVAGGLGVAGMAIYWRGRVSVLRQAQQQASVRPALPALTTRQSSPMSDQQILAYARRAGYLVERRPGGVCEVINPATNRLVSRHQLLLEVSK